MRSTRSIAVLALCGWLSLAMARPAPADDASKHDKVVELMKLEGLDEALERQRRACRKQAQEVGPQMIDQMMKGFSLSPDDPQVKQMNAAYMRFVEASEPPYTTDEAVDLYARLYGSHVTEDEVEELLRFYRSPLGKKAIAASRAAIPEWMDTLQKKNQEVLLKNTQEFTAALKKIMRDEEKGATDEREHDDDPPL